MRLRSRGKGQQNDIWVTLTSIKLTNRPLNEVFIDDSDKLNGWNIRSSNKEMWFF